jgi:TonB-dependent receptor
MHDKTAGRIRPNRLSYAVSLALASLVASNAALAQETAAQQQPAKTEAAAPDGEIAKVIVSTRRSQQSSIGRKKNAATAMDSIVAEDVGSLPDRNIGEAISRMAGIAVDRGDYGEGISVSVRGNGADLTRVELDGQAVQSAGGTDMNGGGDGRGTEFRQLSADLIKSVDVVKGSTADMTEGSLGGGIVIKTRTGLDFQKPFVSVRVAGTQSSLNKKWDPDTNLILSNKFLDGRLGVLLNASAMTLTNESHQFQTSSSGNTGYMRMVDFDNSPEKTFTYHPETLDMSNPDSTKPINTLAGSNGYVFTAATPQEVLTKSAAAKTKADCFAAFPTLATNSAQISPLSNANRVLAVNLRSNEQLSCLHQWDDYIPSLVRYFVKRQVDSRRNLDLRTDFKVNRELTLYAKGSYSKRKVDDNYLTYSLGNVAINDTGYLDSAANVRSAVPGSGRYLYPNSYTYWSGKPLLSGAVMNVIPSSVVVDSTHHVTQFMVDGAGVGVDQIRNQMGTTTRYLQLGGTYKPFDGLTAEFFVGDSVSKYYRGDMRTSWGYTIGDSTLTMAPSGIWAYSVPAGVNLNDWSKAAVLLAPTSTTAPQLTRTVSANWDPRISETGERTAKLDLTYAIPDSIPFFKRIKGGFNLRDTAIDSWGIGGYTAQAATGTLGQPGYVPAITVPGNRLRSTIVGCQDTPGSLASAATKCAYGYKPFSATSRDGQMVLTQQQFQDIITGAMYAPATATQLFNGASGRPTELIDNWTQIDVQKVFAMAGVPNANYDCIKQCVGSDGKVYDQPVSRVRERSDAFYVMSDFGLDHVPFTNRAFPFGWELEGNMGYRYVRTKVNGTGSMTFKSIVKTAQFDPAVPDAAAGLLTYQTTQNVLLSSKRSSFLPIYNLALWLVPDQVVVRYNHAKTVANPPVSRLLATGTCTLDQRFNDDIGEAQEMSCGTFGNPALKGQENINQNLSVEWYPNKDTMFSASAYEQKGKVGPTIVVPVNGIPLFAGTDIVAPGTTQLIGEDAFTYNTYVNGPPAVRTGVEFSSKTAFTFLPWKLRYTGLDANFTRQHSNLSRLVYDFLTGETLSPRGEPKYSYNWALWYDDGKWQARVAVQAVAAKYSCTAPCGATLNGVNYNLGIYPNTADLGTKWPQYNPGSPQYTDRTMYVDGKLSYRFSKGIDIFIEGRNLTNQTATQSFPSLPYEQGANYASYFYPGRRITIGLNWRTL